MSSNWNPLYPLDKDINPLEDAAREAEWEDNLKELEGKLQKRHNLTDEDEAIEEMFL